MYKLAVDWTAKILQRVQIAIKDDSRPSCLRALEGVASPDYILHHMAPMERRFARNFEDRAFSGSFKRYKLPGIVRQRATSDSAGLLLL